MKWKFPSCSAAASAGGFVAAMLFALNACTPTVRLQAPDEPIRFDVNVNVTEEKRVQIDKAVLDLIQKNPALFGFKPDEVPGKDQDSSKVSSESAPQTDSKSDSRSRSESK